MNDSLQALLKGAIDYAGAFPPASLGPEQAAQNYFQYRAAPDAWMLGRLVCPATELPALARIIEQQMQSSGGNDGWAVAAVLSGGATSAEWRTTLADDLRAVGDFPLPAKVDAVEVALPDSLTRATSYGELRELLGPLLDELAGAAPPAATIFIESPPAAEAVRGDLICWTVKYLGEHQKQKALPAGKMAFKLRTGGITAQPFLSSVELARAICVLRDAGVSWKATAGLHHPLPHYDVALGAYAAGFVNLLSAAVMAGVHHLPDFEVQLIVEDESAASFQFGLPEFRWNGLSATLEQVESVRRRSLLSFGSCSFDEPRNDLRVLGWL
ncbi:MAG TPA: hypothetical protein VMV10_28765 [Pirellulales bacterium]|nr:hypothetical protein [Pirellulales bacterium]